MANTTADKLALLEATKADLKAALAEKGQTVGDVFSAYPAAVRAIETGGGETATLTYGNGGNNPNLDAAYIYLVNKDGDLVQKSTLGIQVLNSSEYIYDIPYPCLIACTRKYKDSWKEVIGNTDISTVYKSVQVSNRSVVDVFFISGPNPSILIMGPK